jgi:hypothetical protein
MATKPRATEQDHIADARVVIKQTRDAWTDIEAANKGRKIPLLTKKQLEDFEAKIDAAAKSIGKQHVVKTNKTQATASEVDQRKVIKEQLKDIREDVALAFPNNVPLQRAFGRGKSLSSNVTNTLVHAATAMIEAYDDSGNRKLAADAGVSPARIKTLTAARDALVAADSTQRHTQATARTHTVNKTNLLSGVPKGTALLRRVVKRVSKNDKAKIAALKPTTSRRTPKKRATAKIDPDKKPK